MPYVKSNVYFIRLYIIQIARDMGESIEKNDRASLNEVQSRGLFLSLLVGATLGTWGAEITQWNSEVDSKQKGVKAPDTWGAESARFWKRHDTEPVRDTGVRKYADDIVIASKKILEAQQFKLGDFRIGREDILPLGMLIMLIGGELLTDDRHKLIQALDGKWKSLLYGLFSVHRFLSMGIGLISGAGGQTIRKNVGIVLATRMADPRITEYGLDEKYGYGNFNLPLHPTPPEVRAEASLRNRSTLVAAEALIPSVGIIDLTTSVGYSTFLLSIARELELSLKIGDKVKKMVTKGASENQIKSFFSRLESNHML